MDKEISVADLLEAVRVFVAEREWEKYHSSKNLAMSIAIEAAELMEHFQWRTAEDGQALLEDPEKKAEIEEELADILIYCLSFANQAEIDISEVVMAKMAKNQGRFPPGVELGY
jgi:NTP pyrophosphatase (non-canonical NTP hydrolase)